MKKFLFITLSMLLLLLTACSPTEQTINNTLPSNPSAAEQSLPQTAAAINDGDQTKTPGTEAAVLTAAESTAITAEPEIPAAIKRIFNSESKFYDTGIMQEISLNELGEAVSSDSSLKVEADSYAIIDLDGNGTSEAVIGISVNDNNYYGYEVLSLTEGRVYGYLLPYRAFNGLKEDGSFFFSSGAADSGFGTLRFSTEGYEIEPIAYSESSYDEKDNLTVRYFIGDKEATEEEFAAAIDEQSTKPDITMQTFDSHLS